MNWHGFVCIFAFFIILKIPLVILMYSSNDFSLSKSSCLKLLPEAQFITFQQRKIQAVAIYIAGSMILVLGYVQLQKNHELLIFERG